MEIRELDYLEDVQEKTKTLTSIRGGYLPLGTNDPSPMWGWNRYLYPNPGYDVVTDIGNINVAPTHPNFFDIQTYNTLNTIGYLNGLPS